MPAHPSAKCWLSDKADLRRSTIEGRGLFAGVDIAAGVTIARLGGSIVSTEALHELLSASNRYVDTVSLFQNQHLVLPQGTSQHFGNHSCEPNLWWVDPLSLTTRSPVAAETELTVDYGTLTAEADFEMICRCGAPTCRGVVTGRDWTRKDLQARYGEHWVPILLDRIRASRITS
jgi:uncharacterized protein